MLECVDWLLNEDMQEAGGEKNQIIQSKAIVNLIVVFKCSEPYILKIKREEKQEPNADVPIRTNQAYASDMV